MNPAPAAISGGKPPVVTFSATQGMNTAQKEGAPQQVLRTYLPTGGLAANSGPGAMINLKT